jgi:hypothetical protein
MSQDPHDQLLLQNNGEPLVPSQWSAIGMQPCCPTSDYRDLLSPKPPWRDYLPILEMRMGRAATRAIDPKGVKLDILIGSLHDQNQKTRRRHLESHVIHTTTVYDGSGLTEQDYAALKAC